MLEENIDISIRKQCKMLKLCRSSYYNNVNLDIEESNLANKIMKSFNL